MAEQIARNARLAANVLKTRSNDARTSALKAIHDTLRDRKDEILKANRVDMELAEKGDYAESLVKRLDLSKGDKYDTMLQGILDVAALEDPVGKIQLARKLDDGLELYRTTCPVGVLLVIFEARPEVIANISALAIKSGNAAILKGGKESTHTFNVMAEAIRDVLAKTDIPPAALQLVSTREQVGDLLSQDEYIDLVVPRGSNALVRNIKNNTRIPVMGHADGICSIYVHSDADPAMASRIAVDAKTNYPAGCNAAETLLLNDKTLENGTAATVLQSLIDNGVECKVVPELQKRLPGLKLSTASEQDFSTEFLALTIAVKPVKSVEEAIDHINAHGSHHTDCFIGEDPVSADKFLKGIDAAGVYWNASTRFADGFRYGFGTEVGVSTNKIHARGPVGLDGLMSYQYILKGHGQVAGDYAGAGGSKHFKHQDL
ncbi:gamma-glutamyl phosphate reductase [Trichomonascus vanleenenianus]|uniref:glutamate-5-semialdehyde dehydrogenase n=1 Tax=Trichomonascus vanleenenianus TaxID=2268995 RepID=UPI003EC9BD06